MKIHEYQAKQIFARYGVPDPEGRTPRSRSTRPRPRRSGSSHETGSPVVVVKAQIHAGGRGKGGGVKVAKGGAAEARELAREDPRHAARHAPDGPRRAEGAAPLHRAGPRHRARALPRRASSTATAGASPSWRRPRAAWRSRRSPHETPEKILTVHVDPAVGLARLPGAQARVRASASAARRRCRKLREAARRASTSCFVAEDCSLCEINPLVVTKDGDVVALDAKINFDDNAEFRHPEWKELARHGRGGPGRARGEGARASTTCRSTATSAASSTAPASRWPRWTSSSTTAAQPGELPRRRRRRQRRSRSRRPSR